MLLVARRIGIVPGRPLSARPVVACDQIDVSRFLPLAFLAPEIVEALMNGRQGVELTAEKMRQILPIPCSWERAASSAELVTLPLLFPHPEVESVLVIVVGRTGRPLRPADASNTSLLFSER